MAHIQRLSAIPSSALARLLGVDWSPHEENTARLYEVLHYWLGLEWIDRITDPEDPEVRKRRAEDRRSGVKPPPYPLVPPVALRPEDHAERRTEAYLAETRRWSKPNGGRARRDVDSDEFDRILGLT